MDIIKPLAWIGSSKKDLLRLPAPVVDVFGYALYLAQTGKRHPNAKVLSGFGDASVVEVIESRYRGTYRAVYTTRFVRFVAVLHVFQKKSKAGVTTPKVDMAMIRDRLKLASELLRGGGK